jgi:ABC-type branched-subunit amino acid transport system substrate-binding protein
MSTALTGPAADLGVNMRAGVDAAFAEVNAAGGSHGRRLRLVALDDGYEPARTAPNMHQLIEQEHVLAVVGNVGTPTAIAALPIANESKVPFFGAFTGAGVLRRTPPDRYVVNFRASYAEETGAMVDALLQGTGLDVAEIAFFTQRDGYGDAGFAGGIAALRRHGLQNETLIAHGRYERNTLGVENGLAEVLQHAPSVRAVIMVGAYAPCAEFIKQAMQYGLHAVFLNVSFVGSSSLAAALGATKARVVVTQVVPHFKSDLEIVRQYRQVLPLLGNDVQPNFGSLEGYVAARILIKALTSIEGDITRESIVDALEGLQRFDLGLGNPLELSPARHQASNGVWPTIIRDREVVPFDWKDLRALLHEDAGK